MALYFTMHNFWILHHELFLLRTALFCVVTQRVVVIEDVTDRLSRNDGTKLPLLAA
jgi:hypothetical protein